MSKIIKIPFREEFREPMLNGKKTMTTRSKKYGEEGDLFEAFGAFFRLILVSKWPLSLVAENYDLEGMDSKEEFIEIWEKIHPRRGYRPDDQRWIHAFELVGKVPDGLQIHC